MEKIEVSQAYDMAVSYSESCEGIFDTIGTTFKNIIRDFGTLIITKPKVKALFDALFDKAEVWMKYTDNSIDDLALKIVRDGFNQHFNKVFDLIMQYLNIEEDKSQSDPTDPTNVTPYCYNTSSPAEVSIDDDTLCKKVSEATGIDIDLIMKVLPVVVYFIKLFFR